MYLFGQLIQQIRQQEKDASRKSIKTDCETVSTSTSSASASASSKQTWSNVLEALNLFPRQPQEFKCSSSSQDHQMSSDNLLLKTTAAQALLMLHNNSIDHDKRSQLSMISSTS